MSQQAAESEVRRYGEIMPGQAPSYFYGLTKILEAKSKIKKDIGSKFSERHFNDAMLSIGLIPAHLIEPQVRMVLKSTKPGLCLRVF